MNKKIILIIIAIIIMLVFGIAFYFARFGTSGGSDINVEEQVFSSERFSNEAVRSIDEQHRLNSPTTFTVSRLPVDKETFSMNFYVDKVRRSYVFVVKLKTISLQQVQEDVNNWLLSEGLTQEQIDTLIIEYDTSFN